MDDKDRVQKQADEALQELRAEGIDHLYCGHCGSIEDVIEVKFPESRHLCRKCRNKILEWI